MTLEDLARRGNPAPAEDEGQADLSFDPFRNRQEAYRKAADEALEVYQTYQENKAKTERIQTAILKGLKQGESISHLFLLAAEGISLLISNKGFLSQVEGDLMAIYGEGLREPGTVAEKLKQTEKRLSMLRAAVERNEDPTERDRIERAIKAHEESIQSLRASLPLQEG